METCRPLPFFTSSSLLLSYPLLLTSHNTLIYIINNHFFTLGNFHCNSALIESCLSLHRSMRWSWTTCNNLSGCQLIHFYFLHWTWIGGSCLVEGRVRERVTLGKIWPSTFSDCGSCGQLNHSQSDLLLSY